MTARREGEDFEAYKARRKVENTAHMMVRIVAGYGPANGRPVTPYTTDKNRRTKRALVKAMGHRQFKLKGKTE